MKGMGDAWPHPEDLNGGEITGKWRPRKYSPWKWIVHGMILVSAVVLLLAGTLDAMADRDVLHQKIKGLTWFLKAEKLYPTGRISEAEWAKINERAQVLAKRWKTVGAWTEQEDSAIRDAYEYWVTEVAKALEGR